MGEKNNVTNNEKQRMVTLLNIVLIIEIVLVFAAIMFIHELGHFVFAKKAGIFVREFSLGLGPKFFSFKMGETMYSLRLLPFGAYVRMAGEDPEIIEIKTGQWIGLKLNQKGNVSDIYLNQEESNHKIKIKVDEIDLAHKLFIEGTDQNENQVKYTVMREAVMHEGTNKIQIAPWDRQFGSKSIKNRFATIFAGPFFNVLLTVVLFFSIAMIAGAPTDQVQLGQISEGSPAQTAGMQEGDILLAINDQSIQSDIELKNKIENSIGKELKVLVGRSGEEMTFYVTPQDLNQTGKGLIGVQLLQVMKKATPTEAAQISVTNTAKMTTLILDGFRMLLTGHVSMDDIAGPVGIMQVTSAAAKQGVATLANWAAILSLYLGIFNLLPIPALDGSRLMFLTIEALRGKPIDPRKESMVHLIGFAFLMLLMVVVTVNDVTKIFH